MHLYLKYQSPYTDIARVKVLKKKLVKFLDQGQKPINIRIPLYNAPKPQVSKPQTFGSKDIVQIKVFTKLGQILDQGHKFKSLSTKRKVSSNAYISQVSKL